MSASTCGPFDRPRAGTSTADRHRRTALARPGGVARRTGQPARRRGQPPLPEWIEPLPEPPLARRVPGRGGAPGAGQQRGADVDLGLLRVGVTKLFTEDDRGGGPRPPAAPCGRRGRPPPLFGHRRRTGTGKTTTVAAPAWHSSTSRRSPGGAAAPHRPVGSDGEGGAPPGGGRPQRGDHLALDPGIGARLLDLRGTTLHRLLGVQPGNRTRFRHNGSNQLRHDVVVVDETSMVSLSMMARLLEARASGRAADHRRRPRAAGVGRSRRRAGRHRGAGSAGSSWAPARGAARRRRPGTRSRRGEPTPSPIGEGIVVLRHVHRIGGAIAALAQAIQRGDADAAMAVLAAGDSNVEWIATDAADPAAGRAPRRVRDRAVESGRAVIEAARAGAPRTPWTRWAGSGCSARTGRSRGRGDLDGPHRNWLQAEVEGFATGRDWYVGRPLIVTRERLRAPPLQRRHRCRRGGRGRPLVAAFERGGAMPMSARPGWPRWTPSTR